MAKNGYEKLVSDMEKIGKAFIGLEKQSVALLGQMADDIIASEISSERQITWTLDFLLDHAYYGTGGAKEKYMELVDYYAGINKAEAEDYRKMWADVENENK